MPDFIVSVVMTRMSGGVINTQNKLYGVSAVSQEEAHGKAIPLAQADFPEHVFHTACAWALTAPVPSAAESLARTDVSRIRKALEAGPTEGPWSRNERLNGPFWHISSQHTIGGRSCGTGRQAVASVHGESKRGASAYAAMFEANADFIAACDPRTVRDLLRELDTLRTAPPAPQPAEAETPDAFPALIALTEAFLTRADSAFMHRQIDAAITVMAARGWTPPVPWPPKEFADA